jgi:hypothetical protein
MFQCTSLFAVWDSRPIPRRKNRFDLWKVCKHVLDLRVVLAFSIGGSRGWEEKVEEYSQTASSKKAAMNAAAEAITLSGGPQEWCKPLGDSLQMKSSSHSGNDITQKAHTDVTTKQYIHMYCPRLPRISIPLAVAHNVQEVVFVFTPKASAIPTPIVHTNDREYCYLTRHPWKRGPGVSWPPLTWTESQP